MLELLKAFSLCYAELAGLPTYQEHEPISMDTTYEEEAKFKIKKQGGFDYVRKEIIINFHGENGNR